MLYPQTTVFGRDPRDKVKTLQNIVNNTISLTPRKDLKNIIDKILKSIY